ncbi:MAG TPA: hypothetical protein PKO15_07525 [Fibrobacteria bacterium]|nr:hypothetical protein [Fibrobacteria bacterium]HOX52376.1 hypothetical protein [Fibrobacteria bacterium]
MFWTFGGTYLLGIQLITAATFAWARWMDPSFGQGSGFWIAGLGTLVLGLLVLCFETVGLVWSPDRKPVQQVLRTLAALGLMVVSAWGLAPFGQAAIMRLAMTGGL